MDLKFAHSGLVAIALVIRSGAGPRFVFHYPARPTAQTSKREPRYGTELDVSDEEIPEDNGDSEESDLEDGGFQLNQAFSKTNVGEKKSGSKDRHVDLLEGDEHYETPSGEHIVPWEHLGEFSTTDLESILTAPRAFHKKKFELTLDPLHFVTYPLHIREDGLWKKKKVKKEKKLNKGSPEPISGKGMSKESEQTGEAERAKAPNSEDEDDHGGMTMFNVVFILNLPKDEADERLQEIYEHVIKKFNKALNHAQASSNYVWKESRMILETKEKARDDRE
jgi:hypothetical protein